MKRRLQISITGYQHLRGLEKEKRPKWRKKKPRKKRHDRPDTEENRLKDEAIMLFGSVIRALRFAVDNGHLQQPKFKKGQLVSWCRSAELFYTVENVRRERGILFYEISGPDGVFSEVYEEDITSYEPPQ